MNRTSPDVSLQSAASLAATLGLSEVALAARLLDVLSVAGVAVGVKDLGTARYVHASDALAEVFSRSAAQMMGVSDADLLDPIQAGTLRAGEQAALARPGPHSGIHRLEIGAQRREFSILRIPLVQPGELAPGHILAVWQEMTATRQQEAQLRSALVQLEQQQLENEILRREARDPLAGGDSTGPFERAQFDDQLRREVDLSGREHREFALVSILLDPLSHAVLALGPPARARVLEALGRLLRGNTRAMDALCRVDQDRFAVLLSGVGLATAHARMEGLRRQCATQIVALEGSDLGFTVSMGVASFPHTAAAQTDLVAAADRALDEAIRRGGNQVALAGIRFEPN
jgi:diguanylate cyclase (GGDEF)-like protein